jgi:hypothetical protein
VSCFVKGQTVRASVTVQGMVKGATYDVLDLEVTPTFAGTFVRYQLRERILGGVGHASDPTIWVGNGHLLLNIVHTKDADCIADGCRPNGDCNVCQVSAFDCERCGGVRYHVAGCPESDAAVENQDGGNALLGADLRDAPIPPHACLENVDDTGHCRLCGEKALRGPVLFRPGTRAMSAKVKRGATVPPLPEKEARFAAKFFTLSNMGQPTPRSVRAVEQAFHTLAACMESETGESIDPEYKSWLKEFGLGRSKADAYFVAEWAKEKATIVGLEALS